MEASWEERKSEQPRWISTTMGKHGMLLWQAAPLGTYNWTIFQTEKKSEKSPKKINKNCSQRPHSNWFTNIFHSLGGWIFGKNIRNTVTERQAGKQESHRKKTHKLVFLQCVLLILSTCPHTFGFQLQFEDLCSPLLLSWRNASLHLLSIENTRVLMMTTGEMNLRGLCTWNILLTPLVLSLVIFILKSFKKWTTVVSY